MKRHAFLLSGFWLAAILFLAGYAPVLTAAALVTTTPTPPRPSVTGTATPAALPAAQAATPAVSSGADDLGAVLRAAYNKNLALDVYRTDIVMTMSAVSPTVGMSPTVLLNSQIQRHGQDSHSITQGDYSGAQELISTDNQLYVRDSNLPGANTWFLVPPDRSARYVQPSAFRFLVNFLGNALNFTLDRSEMLDGVMCRVYLQDRADVIQSYLNASGMSASLTPQQVDDLLDVAENRIWVCDDGLIHQLNLHTITKPASGSTITDLVLRLYDANGDIEIAAPTDTTPLPAPTSAPNDPRIITATPPPTPAIPASITAAQAFTQGLAENKKGNYTGALAYFNKALELDPTADGAYLNRGIAFRHLGQLVQAVADFNKVLELVPGNSNAMMNLGLVYDNQGNTDLALAQYTQALTLDPELAAAYYNRGRLYLVLGAYAFALADLDQAIALDPTDPDAVANRGLLRFDTGDYPAALADLSKAIELNPRYAEAYYYRGRVNVRLENYDQAIADFTKTIEIDPNYAEAYGFRGAVYADRGKRTEAIADLEMYLKLQPNNPNKEQLQQYIDRLKSQ